jgi:hypothetical protein
LDRPTGTFSRNILLSPVREIASADSWGKFPISGAPLFDRAWVTASKTAQFSPFLELARLLQLSVHRRITRRTKLGIETMTTISNYAQHAFAAVSALAISALLFANALATKAAEVHSVVGIFA